MRLGTSLAWPVVARFGTKLDSSANSFALSVLSLYQFVCIMFLYFAMRFYISVSCAVCIFITCAADVEANENFI